MASTQVTVALDPSLLAEVEARAGQGRLSAYVAYALERQLQLDKVGRLLDGLDDDHGPVPDEVRDAVEQEWRDQVDDVLDARAAPR